MLTFEAILKRFWNGDIALILRAHRRGRRVRIYDNKGKEIERIYDKDGNEVDFAYVDMCPTVPDIHFVKEDFSEYYYVVNSNNLEKKKKNGELYRLYT